MSRLGFVLIASALLAAPVAVESQQLAPIPSATEYLDFIEGSGVTGSDWGIANQVGPYVGAFLPGPYRSVATPQFSLFCVDFLGTASPDVDQYVRSTSLAQTDMSGTKLGVGSFAKYTQAAYLSTLFYAWQSNPLFAAVGTQKLAWTGIQSAIWNIMSGGLQPPVTGDAQTLMGSLVSHAATRYSAGWRAPDFYVLTSIDPQTGLLTNQQEFLIVTPEPSTYLLLATGLLFLVAFGRRRLSIRRDDANVA